MGLLSNLLGFRNGPEREVALSEFTVRPVHPEEIEPAVRMLLSPPGGQADSSVVSEFIRLATERGIDLGTIFVARHKNDKPGRISSAALPVSSPGRTMLILTPAAPEGKIGEAATRSLIVPLCETGRKTDVHLAQALTDPGDAALERVYTAEGFARLAELYYLNVTPPPPDRAAMPELPAGLSWVTYSAETHALFGRVVVGSYQGSLDCPALNGLRDVEDILAGHKASGAFDPSTWFLIQDAEAQPLGALLLSESLRGDSMELVYLGLLPAARGRKLGELMMRQSLAVAALRGHDRLCLAVDSRNLPALKLYYRHGMSRIGSKIAWMRDLRASGCS